MIDPNQDKWDAQTLAAANIIKDDPKRVAAASKAAKQLVAKEEKETKAMRQVANKTEPKPKKKRSVPSSGRTLIGHNYGG